MSFQNGDGHDFLRLWKFFVLCSNRLQKLQDVQGHRLQALLSEIDVDPAYIARSTVTYEYLDKQISLPIGIELGCCKARFSHFSALQFC